MKVVVSRSSLRAVALMCGAFALVSSASADMIVHSARRQSEWHVDAAFHGAHGVGYDTHETFDSVPDSYWYDVRFVNYFNPQAYIPNWGFVWIDATAIGQGVGSRFGRDSFTFNVGGNVSVGADGWATASISGLLDTTFTLDQSATYDFHSAGGGSGSVTLWNEAGDVVTSLSGNFASVDVIGPGRYRVLANYSNSTSGGSSSGNLWVSVPAPGSIALLGAGSLIGFRRRR